mmetsp:Transcript_5795/g.5743  ORF Transcript_5795/g.5743 Transcript_5795/m.5743 type:complete len:212 (-) Transcript_5795:309-944(-)
MFSPLEIPPWIPPELLVAVLNLLEFPSATNGSLWADPGILVPKKPEPNSKPLVAGNDNIAWANWASNLSKHGSPKPIGQFLTTHVTTPPMESLLSLYFSITFTISSLTVASGHLIGPTSSTSSLVIVFKIFWKPASCGLLFISISPILDTNATISTLLALANIFSAMAPAATLPIVSLAEDLPPPEADLTPYFCMYVQSACDGLGYKSVSE